MREMEQYLGAKMTGTYFTCLSDHLMNSMFPLKCNGSMPVKIHFIAKDGKLIAEKWTQEEK